MSRIADKLAALKSEGRKGLIIYITAGAPNLEVTLQAVKAAEEAGADIIELGIPFSDPMADGPVIQKAAMLALQSGTTAAKVAALVAEIRKHSDIPLAAMTYMNSVMNFGEENFVKTFRQAGLDGLIVPDLPSEEAEELDEICRQNGLDLIQFAATTTNENRINSMSSKARGFIYCISTTGVTGVRKVDYSNIGEIMKTVRQYTDVPLAIGFGIGTPESAKEAAKYADAVIVGSAVMQSLMEKGVEDVRTLVKSIRQTLDERMS
ncbi:tryptophan synthase subunit alpha [Dendrosporobacter sp. 1207_IL3150]|uniref:tryptophan synthase subunit alpha n=1 Tax=Dendrosporobacter sp. 1207_IL3150 TaxID=3084054 RepID=UPI002FDA90A2